jgi:NAD(P)-dependent dehydrogenase (short-subunit alcohol dehydrogenase family)
MEPRDRVVMISGAGRGIGRAMAERLAADGYRLSLGMRDPARPVPEGAFACRFDALEPDTAGDWVARTMARYGRIDALVNNAGILRPYDLGTTGDEAVLDEMWAVNVKAPLRLVRAALPHLSAAGHGRIVNVASTDGKRYREGVSVAYAMTKHAVMALTAAARAAAWDRGVRATALCPGAVDTDLLAGVPGATPPDQRLDPGTIADAVAFLLSLPDMASVPELVLNTRKESLI